MKHDEMNNGPADELPTELRQQMARYRAPPQLHRRVRFALAQQQQPQRAGLLQWLRSGWRTGLPLGASFACGALLVLALQLHRAPSPGEGSAGQEVVANHVRSLMVSHLTDVASTDQHTVKPWFSGQLDYAPPVIDLAREGFPLVGGRLDYLQGRPVAALVYRRNGHTINVFVLPSAAAQALNTQETLQGYQLARWDRAGMRFWAVSDLGATEMAAFAAAMQAAP